MIELLDRNDVIVYVVMQGRHKPDAYRHSVFTQDLMTQLFHIARKFNYPILWTCASVSFHNPLPQVWVEVQEEVLLQALVFPGNVRGSY